MSEAKVLAEVNFLGFERERHADYTRQQAPGFCRRRGPDPRTAVPGVLDGGRPLERRRGGVAEAERAAASAAACGPCDPE